MPTFTYTAKNTAGAEVRGKVEADSRKQAIRMLGSQNLVPVQMQEGALGVGKQSRRATGNRLFAKGKTGAAPKLSRSCMLPFLRALSDLLACGIQVGDGVRLLSRRMTNPKLRTLAGSMWDQLSQGQSLSGAMAAVPEAFDESAISLVEAGEATGNLGTILQRLVANLEERKEIQTKVLTALAYPIFIICVALGVVAVFLFFLIPRIQTMMASLGSHLPLMTRIVIGLSKAMIAYGPIVILGAVLGSISLWSWRRTAKGRLWCDQVVLRITGLGAFLRDSDMLRLSQTLGLLLENGITMITALAMTERTILNRVIRKAFNEARQKIAEGMPLSSAFNATGYFPDMVVDILTVGDNTGNIVPSLREVARYYSKRQAQQLGTFLSVISIAVLFFAFAFVGMIAIGIISSVFQLSASLHTV